MRLGEATSEWAAAVDRILLTPTKRPLRVAHSEDFGWAYLCRQCERFDVGYLYQDDAIQFGMHHLRTHAADRKAASA